MKETVADIKNRRSVKEYKKEQISDAELMEVLEAGMNAPSGGNRQSAVFIVVQNREWIDKLCVLNAKIAGAPEGWDVFYGAPTVIVVLADSSSYTCVEDGSLAMGNLMNAAHALGVDSCWIHRARPVFDSDEGKALLKKWGVDGPYIGVGHCVLGYREGELKEAAPRRENRVFRP